MDRYYLAHTGPPVDEEVGFICTPSLCIPLGGVILTILSSLGSVVGGLLIIGTFLYWKDLRTVARMILVFLAFSDLLAGIGYIFGAAVYLHYYYVDGDCPVMNNTHFTSPNTTSYNDLCTAQSFFTTLMPVASFLWTANLAIYLLVSVVWPRMKSTKRLMIFFHVFAWGVPLVTCVGVAGAQYFGPSNSRSSGGWCWIKYKDKHHFWNFFAAELMAGKIWEFGVCLLAVFVWLASRVVMSRRFPKKSKV
jgi:G protein-coupled receptor 157